MWLATFFILGIVFGIAITKRDNRSDNGNAINRGRFYEKPYMEGLLKTSPPSKPPTPPQRIRVSDDCSGPNKI